MVYNWSGLPLEPSKLKKRTVFRKELSTVFPMPHAVIESRNIAQTHVQTTNLLENANILWNQHKAKLCSTPLTLGSLRNWCYRGKSSGEKMRVYIYIIYTIYNWLIPKMNVSCIANRFYSIYIYIKRESAVSGENLALLLAPSWENSEGGCDQTSKKFSHADL